MQTSENIQSMDYLQPKLPSRYRNTDTLAHYVIRHGAAGGEGPSVNFWRDWWTARHQDFEDITAR